MPKKKSDLDLDIDLNLDLDFDALPNGVTRAGQIVRPREAIEFDPSDDYAENARMSVEGVLEAAIEAEDEAEDRAIGSVIQTARQNQARADANTSEFYYLTIVFLDARQAEEFYRQAGWDKIHPPCGYIDGLALAKHMGIELPESAYAPYDLDRADAKLNELSFELDEEME